MPWDEFLNIFNFVVPKFPNQENENNIIRKKDPKKDKDTEETDYINKIV